MRTLPPYSVVVKITRREKEQDRSLRRAIVAVAEHFADVLTIPAYDLIPD
jgi:hypothetical protein